MNGRIHIGLAVRDLARAVPFYETLLGTAPSKQKPGYAKFEPSDPPVLLSLNETPEAQAPALPHHYGVQVASAAQVHAARERLTAAGLEPRLEEETGCCYATQTKVWVNDPDGHMWEVFVTLADIDTRTESGCCR